MLYFDISDSTQPLYDNIRIYAMDILVIHVC
jgi:hypothetical protein